MSAAFMVSACTPDIENSIRKEWKLISDYNYLKSYDFFFDRKVIPLDEKYEYELSLHEKACLESYAYNRTLSANGVSDPVSYRHCYRSPAPAPVPSRWNGR